ncbi:MAG: DUF481 domain-containing protein [Paracoccus sp. (in: a-proteobacteria)]|uniref:DUF481 domain-containing protein n=1 Tax=Paracoccus sp. TaxID=267 RepID=UPI0026E06CD0|nr:DUF481 domain-containing protein [Paracoccus sp. (in: a-proteobacteria)]MDO5614108.1 DUF481 domain-containing protein [Paracoccus sp. (in: a-proteobacteria)]
MKNIASLAGASAILVALSVPAFAQSEIATGANAAGITEVNEAMTDVEDAVRDDFARSQDRDRFGPADRRQGLFGSVALTYAGSSGNTDEQDFALAARLNHNQGQWAQSLGMLLEFGENTEGTKDKEETYVIYDGQYYFDDRLYGFVLGRLSTDALAEGDNLRRDGFLGFGPGYRVLNTPDTTWRVQAGVGIRYTATANQRDGLADESSTTETGYILASRFYHRFNENVFVTNDTDILSSSDAGDAITNELGLNLRMSDAFATRVSYTTEYQSEREIRTDNKLGVSLVYGF